MKANTFLSWVKPVTLRCHYNAVNFQPNPHKIHHIARPRGWDMGCYLWSHTLIYTPLQPTQYCMKYRVILGHVITALDCIQLFCEFVRTPFQINEDLLILILLLKHMSSFKTKGFFTPWNISGVHLTPLPIVPHICVDELGQHLCR